MRATNVPAYPPTESASPYRPGRGKDRQPFWYETQVRLPLPLAVAAVLLLAGCGTPAPRVSAWVPPSAAAPAPAPSEDPRTGPPQPVPGKVMLGAYLDLAGMSEAQSLALRHQQLRRDPRILHRYYTWTDPLPD